SMAMKTGKQILGSRFGVLKDQGVLEDSNSNAAAIEASGGAWRTHLEAGGGAWRLHGEPCQEDAGSNSVPQHNSRTSLKLESPSLWLTAPE
ncbi:hypothetical protein ATANTOWER_025815, partial [Ataeniobius toweri]|nr:hypothetical protein [Ataeniobius toweri]